MDDDALIARQADLQSEAAALVDALDLIEVLGRAGRVVRLGSCVTGLMVWRDIDFAQAELTTKLRGLESRRLDLDHGHACGSGGVSG